MSGRKNFLSFRRAKTDFCGINKGERSIIGIKQKREQNIKSIIIYKIEGYDMRNSCF